MGTYDCRPGKTHAFDPESGWCRHGCGVRDDARVVTHAGNPIRTGRAEDPDELRRRIDPHGED